MKSSLKLLIGILFLTLSETFGQGQTKDLIIYEADTFPINTPVVYGTDSNGFFINQSLYEVKNDSIFLLLMKKDNIPYRSEAFERNANSFDNYFASYFDFKIKIPIGDQLYCYTCISPLYEKYRILTFKDGIVIKEATQSNNEKVLYHDQLDKITKVKEFLIDSLASVLDPLIDTISWHQSDCDWDYTLHFVGKGRLNDITMEDTSEIYPEDEKCLANLKKALKGFEISHLALPKVPFEVTVEIWHLDGKFDVDR